MNRALRAATVGVLLVSPLALSACSAGQVNQTATQLRDKVGPTARAGEIELRAVELAYPRAGSYSPGDDAELRMAIVNDGDQEDTLTGISGPSFSRVRITGSPTGTGAPAAPAAPGGTTSTGAGSITIPADSVVYLGQNSQTVTLVDLGEELLPSQSLEITFTFAEAGEVTLDVPVGAPDEEVERGEAFDFHQEENEGEETNTEVSGGIATQREEGEGEG
ncbi:copper chaperone PCu(A)C [Geodermatophilus sp. SYSU D00815]